MKSFAGAKRGLNLVEMGISGYGVYTEKIYLSKEKVDRRN